MPRPVSYKVRVSCWCHNSTTCLPPRAAAYILRRFRQSAINYPPTLEDPPISKEA